MYDCSAFPPLELNLTTKNATQTKFKILMLILYCNYSVGLAS